MFSGRRIPAMVGVLCALLAGCGPVSSGAPVASGPSAAATGSIAATPAPAAAASASASGSPGAAPSGSLDPARFSTTIDNPWFPLTPGTTFTYKGSKDGEPAIDTFKVTAETIVVDGVTCLAIDDRLTLSGVLHERTRDYYSQDLEGNVWYFGEDTAELDAKGKVVSTEGTWHSGVDGAVAGIFLNGNPKVGDTFLQEFYKGHAEDHFQVLDLAASITVPFGSFKAALLTKEWTPLEPGVVDHKYYVRDVGEVKEVSVKGPLERLELVKVVGP